MLNDLSNIIQRAPGRKQGLKLLFLIIRSGGLCGEQGLGFQREDLVSETRQHIISCSPICKMGAWSPAR